MIDIENAVYTRIYNVLKNAYTNVEVSGVYLNTPSSFPYVSIIEQDNHLVEYDTSDIEKYAKVMYEVNVYDNNDSNKKSTCKSILNTIDKEMYRMNLIRTTYTPVPNMADTSIYRLVARYEGVTDGVNIYRG